MPLSQHQTCASWHHLKMHGKVSGESANFAVQYCSSYQPQRLHVSYYHMLHCSALQELHSPLPMEVKSGWKVHDHKLWKKFLILTTLSTAIWATSLHENDAKILFYFLPFYLHQTRKWKKEFTIFWCKKEEVKDKTQRERERGQPFTKLGRWKCVRLLSIHLSISVLVVSLLLPKDTVSELWELKPILIINLNTEKVCVCLRERALDIWKSPKARGYKACIF